jgi:hypothetical protein
VNKDDSLAERYEQIRRTFLGRQQPVAMWGLAVLRTRGMAAWVKSWREYGGGEVKHRSAGSLEPAASHLLPGSEEVVRVLAEMVWAIHEEAVS